MRSGLKVLDGGDIRPCRAGTPRTQRGRWAPRKAITETNLDDGTGAARLGKGLAMKTIDDLEVRGRRVLVRADLNVPLDGTRMTDDGKIRACLPTLNALLDRGAAVVVCSHLGRPAGAPDPAYTLAPVASCLGRLLVRPVVLAADTVGPSARSAVAALQPGGVVMLENLRFNAGETSKDDTLRELLPISWRLWPTCISATDSGPCIGGMPASAT
jgi:Phosphoglycerate kinase